VSVNGREELACRYVVESDITVETARPLAIRSESGIEESGRVTENLCFALDIGTTTLALALVSLDEGRAVRVITATNPQRAFGADVITRIDYCRRHSVEPLHRALVARINDMIASFGVADGKTLYVVGNVTMLHTLFGVDPTPIGVAPYRPAFLDAKDLPASSVGLCGVGRVVSLPSIAAFVGADIVAGLHRIGLPEDRKYNLLLDLGTNAEAVLYSAEGGLATSAAAGPCFEGANISCGMSATDGAICAFELRGGRPVYQTVGDLPPRGICGTGLVDLVAELLRAGIIDGSGYMEKDYQIAEGVFLSPDDVRQLQLAKAAICAAVQSLIREAGIRLDDVAALYLAGGFSTSIDLQNAARVGLFPTELVDRAVALSNTALQGAIRYACAGGDLSRLQRGIRYLDLASLAAFSELFIKNMTFA
jgi:uncharacterized 2Fe-2S/4Fe-4S cluster protein (DUF4445 family)